MKFSTRGFVYSVSPIPCHLMNSYELNLLKGSSGHIVHCLINLSGSSLHNEQPAQPSFLSSGKELELPPNKGLSIFCLRKCQLLSAPSSHGLLCAPSLNTHLSVCVPL